jgi:hypothetical protein
MEDAWRIAEMPLSVWHQAKEFLDERPDDHT